MAGYSGTPLPKKLGVKDGGVVAVLDAPAGFDLGVPLAPGAPACDVLLAFFDRRAALEAAFPSLRARLKDGGGLWIGWPKKASGRATDLTEDVVRGVGLAGGLVDNKVCAIDDVWSGLRLVVRVKDRR
jgi:hypothetical protein